MRIWFTVYHVFLRVQQAYFFTTDISYEIPCEDHLASELQEEDPEVVSRRRAVQDILLQVEKQIKPQGTEHRLFVLPEYQHRSLQGTKDVNVTYFSNFKRTLQGPVNYNISIMFCMNPRCFSQLKSVKWTRELPEYTRLSPIPNFTQRFIDIPPCLTAKKDMIALKALGYPAGAHKCWHMNTHDWDEFLDEYDSMNTSDKTIQPREIRHGGLYAHKTSDRARLHLWQYAYSDGQIFLEAQEPTLQLQATPRNQPWILQTFFLVTSLNPLRVYMYKDGYVRHLNSICKYEYKVKMDEARAEEYDRIRREQVKAGWQFESPSTITWGPVYPCGPEYSFPSKYENLSSFSWLEEQLIKGGKSPTSFWQNVERTVVRSLLLTEASPPLIENTFDNHFQMFEASLQIDESGRVSLLGMQHRVFYTLENLKIKGFSGIYESVLKDTRDILSYADVSHKVLNKLDKFRSNVGYDFVSFDCMPLFGAFPATCLTQKDLKYLLRLEMEAENLGQYRRVYPCSTCGYYTELLRYAKKNNLLCDFGKNENCTAHTSRIHKFITMYSETL